MLDPDVLIKATETTSTTDMTEFTCGAMEREQAGVRSPGLTGTGTAPGLERYRDRCRA